MILSRILQEKLTIDFGNKIVCARNQNEPFRLYDERESSEFFTIKRQNVQK